MSQGQEMMMTAKEKEARTILNLTNKKLRAAYTASLREIQNELAEAYRRYAVKGTLTYAEMAKYGRLESLEKQINAEIAKLSGSVNSTITSGTASMYDTGFLRTAWSIENELLANVGFTRLPKQAILEAIDNPLAKGSLRRLDFDTKIRVNQAVTQSLINGESYAKMAKRLDDTAEFAYNNAYTIARTEGHRAVELGNLDAMQHAEEKGVKIKKIWVSNTDAKVRDTHQSMDGQKVAVSDDFKSPSGASGPAPGQMGEASEDINCFIADTAIYSESKIQKAYRRDYKGELINITTATGIKLTGTPNHPILTDDGWVALKEVVNGKNVICAPLIKNTVPADPNINNKPAVISEVFDFLSVAGTRKRARGVAKQFHGDGFNGYVDIVNVKRKLVADIKTTGAKPADKQGFTFTDSVGCETNRTSILNFRFFTSRSSTNSIMGFFSKCVAFLRSCLTHSHIHCFASVSGSDAGGFNNSSNYTASDIKLTSNSKNRITGKVFVDCVIDRNISSYCGHVYNLQTEKGFYVASNSISDNMSNGNGIVVHNCRCTMAEVVEGFEPTDRRFNGEGTREYQSYNDWINKK
jgi:hypothetical protein